MNARNIKIQIALASLLATGTALAANFGGTTTTTTAPAGGTTSGGTTSSVVVTPPAATGPQAATLFRVAKQDGATIIAQGNMGATAASADLLTVSENDALSKGHGMCAFNVKYDEVSATAASGTTNRLFSNDNRPIAINSMISLTPGVIKTIWTQPYLTTGLNNVRVVINADSGAPSTKWIRINVLGACGGTPAPTVATTTTTTAHPTTTTTTTTTTVVKRFGPGTAEWNNLNIVYGYSNYATTQLKGKGYSRYDELVKLNTAVTGIINAKSIDQNAYNSVMTGWNTFITDPVFKSMMAAVVPASNGK
jgi:hypothetical protein